MKTRNYSMDLRAAAVEATRERILEAAAGAFLERWYDDAVDRFGKTPRGRDDFVQFAVGPLRPVVVGEQTLRQVDKAGVDRSLERRDGVPSLPGGGFGQHFGARGIERWREVMERGGERRTVRTHYAGRVVAEWADFSVGHGEVFSL